MLAEGLLQRVKWWAQDVAAVVSELEMLQYRVAAREARIAHLEQHVAELAALARRPHDVCEDSWYTCPKHPEGGDNIERVGSACDCGADEHNDRVDHIVKRSQ